MNENCQIRHFLFNKNPFMEKFLKCKLTNRTIRHFKLLEMMGRGLFATSHFRNFNDYGLN